MKNPGFIITIIIILILFIVVFKCINIILVQKFKNKINLFNAKPIPLFIHQTWKSKTDLPPEYIKGTESWKSINPEFKHFLYDDQDCLEFITKWYPEYLGLYLKLELPVQKADVFRYLVLHKYGGVYTDIDTLCLKPIKPILDENSVILVTSVTLVCTVVGIEYLPEHNNGKTQIIQWFFASVPGNPVMLEVVNRINFRVMLKSIIGIKLCLWINGYKHEDDSTLWLTGPYIFSQVITDIPDKYVKIYPRCTFGSWDTRDSCISKSYLIHGFKGSWKKNPKVYPIKI